MPTPYFTKFPTILYDIDNTGTNSRFVVDVIHRSAFLQVVLNNLIIFYPYMIQDGETPDIIADKLYGSSMYYWIVLFANNIHNIWTDWPLTYDQLQAYLIQRYGSVPTSQTTIDHYEDASGAFIDLATYNATVSKGSVRIYAYDYANTLNEQKKQIQLVDPQYIGAIETQLDQLMVPPTVQ